MPADGFILGPPAAPIDEPDTADWEYRQRRALDYDPADYPFDPEDI